MYPTTLALIDRKCCISQLGGYPQLGGCWGVGECEYCSAHCLCILTTHALIFRYVCAVGIHNWVFVGELQLGSVLFC